MDITKTEAQIEKAKKVLERLGLLLKRENLEEKDQEVLNGLNEIFGSHENYPMKFYEYHLEDILSIHSLNQLDMQKRDQLLDSLIRNLRASLFVSEFQPDYIDGYYCFNKVFKPKKSYSQADLKEVFKKLDEMGIFNFETIEDLGLMRTSETINADMRWQWVTDSSMMGFYQKKADPKAWRKSLIINSCLYAHPSSVARIDDAIHNPGEHRHVVYDGPGIQDRGVFHTFNPESIKFDKDGYPDLENFEVGTWTAPKRVESQALLLKDLLENVLAAETEEWGFKENEEFHGKNKEYVFQTIALLTKYLLAVNYNDYIKAHDLKAPSVSSWEEVTFWNGATSDTAIVVMAFKRLRELLKAKREGLIGELVQVLKKTVISEPPYVNFFDKSLLNNFIRIGEDEIYYKVIKAINEDFCPIQTLERHADTSLILLAASDYVFNLDPIKDSEIRLGVIKKMKKCLMGVHGMRRFNTFTHGNVTNHDSYLSLNYQAATEITPVAQVKSGDLKPHEFEFTRNSQTDKELEIRGHFSHEDYVAQWTIGTSAAIQALIKMQKKLENFDSTIKKDIEEELADFLNNTLCHIAQKDFAGMTMIRSDGSELPRDFCVMEAYQAISDLDGNIKWLPGAHTLTWTAVQLYDALI